MSSACIVVNSWRVMSKSRASRSERRTVARSNIVRTSRALPNLAPRFWNACSNKSLARGNASSASYNPDVWIADSKSSAIFWAPATLVYTSSDAKNHRVQASVEGRIYALHSLYFAVLRHRLGNFQQCCQALMLSSEIDLLMYSTFAVQSGESARQQRLALVLPYVVLWSIEGEIHLEKCNSRTDPRPSGWLERTRPKANRVHVAPLLRSRFRVPARRRAPRPHRSVCLPQARGCGQVDPDHGRAPVRRKEAAGAHHRRALRARSHLQKSLNRRSNQWRWTNSVWPVKSDDSL